MEVKEKKLILLKYAFLTFVIILLFSIVLPLIGASFALSQNLMIVVLGAEIYFCCIELKRKAEAELSFKSAFTVGFQVSFLAGLLNSLFVMFVILGVGNTAIREAMYKSKALIYQGGDDAMFEKIVVMISNPFIIALFTVILYLIIGILLSLFVAFFIKSPFIQSGDEK